MNNGKKRINAWVSPKAYAEIDKIMADNKIGGMKVSKGLVLSVGIAILSQSLDVGESFENIVVQVLEGEFL